MERQNDREIVVVDKEDESTSTVISTEDRMELEAVIFGTRSGSMLLGAL